MEMAGFKKTPSWICECILGFFFFFVRQEFLSIMSGAVFERCHVMGVRGNAANQRGSEALLLLSVRSKT